MSLPGHYPTSAFEYDLPDSLIARHPAPARDASRLLVVDRAGDRLLHRRFTDILDYLTPSDALVLNETKVIPARLLGRRASGAPAEVLLLEPVTTAAQHGAPAPGSSTAEDIAADAAACRPLPATWVALVRPGAKLRAGRIVAIADDLRVEILDVLPDGARVVLDAVVLAEADVHQQQVGLTRAEELARLLRVGRHADDLVAELLEVAAQPQRDEAVVLDDQHAARAVARARRVGGRRRR